MFESLQILPIPEPKSSIQNASVDGEWCLGGGVCNTPYLKLELVVLSPLHLIA